jgi:hypothetical protein
MKKFLNLRNLLLLIGLSMSFGLTGCATNDELSPRPWNAPKNWENGLPSQMMEGR